MGYPRLEIDLIKLEENARMEVREMVEFGVTVMGVNKVFNGLPQTAEAIVRGGIEAVAESRISNLRKLQGVPGQKCLLRSPCLSEIEDTVRYADISLNSEVAVLQALSKEAVRQNKIHRVLLMVDMGDIREGIWFEDLQSLEAAVKTIIDLPQLEIYGLGTNFSCFGSVLPSLKNGRMFIYLARTLESKISITFPYLSGGNCTSYRLMRKGVWPEGINHLRIGALHQFGIEYADIEYLDAYHHSDMEISRLCSNLYILKAEIIEANTKPTVPFGELGVDCFMKAKIFQDQGPRKRALLALGHQDVAMENCWPVDPQVRILGQSFDHTIIDIEDCDRHYRVGDIVSFELDYTGLNSACSADSIVKRFIED
ncbi:alanine/ornithine racemase family PLP-dependent enzyme [Acidobacteriota bacterium]